MTTRLEIISHRLNVDRALVTDREVEILFERILPHATSKLSTKGDFSLDFGTFFTEVTLTKSTSTTAGLPDPLLTPSDESDLMTFVSILQVDYDEYREFKKKIKIMELAAKREQTSNGL